MDICGQNVEKSLCKFSKNEAGLYRVYDRFSFDGIFRVLLNNGLDHEEALAFILCNCALSAIVFQERIENDYFLKISVEETIFQDLLRLTNQMLYEIVVQRHPYINN